MRVLLSAGANILRRDWKPICLSQRSLFGLEDEHKTPFKAQRKTDKWRLRDGASESETMVYVGPWSDTARWLQSGLLGLSAMTATGAFLHVTGVSPLMDTVLPSAGSLDELTTGEFFFAAAVTMTACAIAQYTTSKLVLRIYHDDEEHEFRVVQMALLPWRNSSTVVNYGGIKAVGVELMKHCFFRDARGRKYLLFNHRFRRPEDFNRLMGFHKFSFDDDDDDYERDEKFRR